MTGSQPPEIEKQISVLVQGIMQGVEAQKYSALWNSYMYTRVACALLEASQAELTDTIVELLRATKKSSG
jgi:hypothetical protein